MKQNNLNPAFLIAPAAEQGCLGRVITTFALYGLAMAVLWSFAGPSPWMKTAVWVFALIVGVKLGRRLWEE